LIGVQHAGTPVHKRAVSEPLADDAPSARYAELHETGTLTAGKANDCLQD
jgi:hypothetical protein